MAKSEAKDTKQTAREQRKAEERQAKAEEQKKSARETQKEVAEKLREDEERRRHGEDPEDEEVVEIGGEASDGLTEPIAPGTLVAPASNPGAAARVPARPLQPESLQSHGKGIISDKDTTNPPYNSKDPLHVDAGPSGSGSETNTSGGDVDKGAEREKAERQTSHDRATDPDNPTQGGETGGKDATASPRPIGSNRE